MKKLYRSKTDKKIAGVCAGLANYVNIDPTVIRILYVVISLLSTGVPGIVIYIICLFIMPEEPDTIEVEYQEHK